MAAQLAVREISSVHDVRAAAAVIDGIWGERVITPELLRAIATHGGLALGAFQGDTLVGAQMGFVGLMGGRAILHSHVTGVAPDMQNAGVGFSLKLAQREWCLARGIDTITWTFDPLIARNARFNLHKLGAVADGFVRDFYGPMDDALNLGERTDRLEIRWELRSPRVEAALAGKPEEHGAAGSAVVLDDRGGRPLRSEAGDAPAQLIRIPRDYQALKASDAEAAREWRDAVAEAMEAAMGRGFRAMDFLRDGAYVLERA
jgi:predicted GNAT superfamily acetyltransferase